MLSANESRAAAERLVERATSAGASAADALYVGSRSTNVQVRLGELESVSRSESEEIGLRVFLGSQSATVASSDLSDEALGELVQRALAMAAEAPEDRFAGLAPDALLAGPPFPQLDSVDPFELDPEALRLRALDAESAARAVPRVTNSNGSSAGTSRSKLAPATSGGFAAVQSATGFSCSASMIAGEGSSMQRDHAWHSARHLADLDSAQEIGRLAGERAVARLNPERPKSGGMPVLFDPRVSHTLLGHLAGAITGSSIARKSSFLQNKLGERVFADGVTIVDDPLRLRGLRSRPFAQLVLQEARLASDG